MNLERFTFATLITTLFLLLAACGQQPAPTPTGELGKLGNADTILSDSPVIIEQLDAFQPTCFSGYGPGIGQTFTATATGRLVSVALAPYIFSPGTPVSNVTLSVRAADRVTVLHSQNIATFADAGGSLVTYQLTTPVEVVAGQVYAFDVNIECDAGLRYASTFNPYPDGSAYHIGGDTFNRDFAFRAVIDPKLDTSITAQPPAFSYSASASFSFSGINNYGSALAGFECKLDGGSFAACPSPQSYTSLTEGSHTFTVRAKDADGNVDPTPASYTWEIQLDNTAPTAAPSQSPAANSNGWNNSDVTVNWNWSDAGTGIDSANCTTTSTSSGEGTIKLTATCKDKAGNEGSKEYTVKVDKTTPKCTATVNPVSLWSPNHKLTNVSTTVSVSDTNADGFILKSVTSSEADSGLGTDDVPNDIQGWVLNTADTSGQLRSERYSKNGRTYTFTYQAKDKAGNTGTCTASVSVPKSQK